MISKSFLTAKEIAELLKLNLLTVYEYIRNGKLKALSFGRNYRIDEDDLEDFLNKHRVIITSQKQEKNGY